MFLLSTKSSSARSEEEGARMLETIWQRTQHSVLLFTYVPPRQGLLFVSATGERNHRSCYTRIHEIRRPKKSRDVNEPLVGARETIVFAVLGYLAFKIRRNDVQSRQRGIMA